MKLDKEGHKDHCRLEYTQTAPGVKEFIEYLKLNTNTVIHVLGTLMEQQTDGDVRRLFAIARTEYENACMWAVKALTSEDFNDAHASAANRGGNEGATQEPGGANKQPPFELRTPSKADKVP
jgi:hypothetical protein